MLSLSILLALFIISLLATAWATALTARLVGSPRGRLRTALLAILLIAIFSLILTAIQQALPLTPPQPPPPPTAFHRPPPQPVVTPALIGIVAVGLLLVVAQLVGSFLILRRTFRLSAGRTFAPFAAFFATNILILALTILFLRPHLFEAFIMPRGTESMAPTLATIDRIMVVKVVTPRRWDLVAYHAADPQRTIFCKRLIGLPGDRLRFENNQLFINDQPTTPPAPLVGHLRPSPVGMPPSEVRYHDGETIPLGPDQFFLIGDNPDISADSRLFGPSNRPDLVGVVDLIYWPPHKFRVLR